MSSVSWSSLAKVSPEKRGKGSLLVRIRRNSEELTFLAQQFGYRGNVTTAGVGTISICTVPATLPAEVIQALAFTCKEDFESCLEEKGLTIQHVIEGVYPEIHPAKKFRKRLLNQMRERLAAEDAQDDQDDQPKTPIPPELDQEPVQQAPGKRRQDLGLGTHPPKLRRLTQLETSAESSGDANFQAASTRNGQSQEGASVPPSGNGIRASSTREPTQKDVLGFLKHCVAAGIMPAGYLEVLKKHLADQPSVPISDTEESPSNPLGPEAVSPFILPGQEAAMEQPPLNVTYQPRQKVPGLTVEEQLEFCKAVADQLPNVTTEHALTMDYGKRQKELPPHLLFDLIIKGQNIDVYSVTQSSKTVINAYCALPGVAQKRGTILLVADTLGNIGDQTDKLGKIFHDMNETSAMQEKGSPISVRHVNPAAMKNLLQPDREAFLAGRLVLVIGHQESHIHAMAKLLRELKAPVPILVIDEADKLLSTANIDQGMEQGLCGSMVSRPHMTKREAAFQLLIHQVAPDAVPDRDPGFTKHFPALHSLVKVTATPMDTVVWQLVNKIPFHAVLSDMEAIISHGYIGMEHVKPFTSNGEEVFLQPGEMTPRTKYGLETNADGSLVPHKVVEFYRAVDEKRQSGGRGILVLDVCNPRVNTADNMEQRGETLVTAFPCIVLVITGKGIQEVRRGTQGTLIEKKRLVWFRKKSRVDVLEDLQTLQDTIARYDDELGTPLVVIGYNMIKRSLSCRSGKRVPTHLLLHTSSGISLADMVQMEGRMTGRNRTVLESHGYNPQLTGVAESAGDTICILTLEQDYRSVKLYDKFVRQLYRVVGEGRGEMDMLHWSQQKFPKELMAVLDNPRRQGQRHMYSGAYLQRRVHFTEPGESGTDSEMAEAAEGVADAADNAAITETEEFVLMGIWQLHCSALSARMPVAFTSAQIAKHCPVLAIHHCAQLTTLWNKRYIGREVIDPSAASTSSAGCVYVYSLTDDGERYCRNLQQS